MLFGSSSSKPPIAPAEIVLTPREKDVLRRLVGETAAVAALSAQKVTAELWRRLNDLDAIRPMVWITEVPWQEVDADDELALQTEHPWARSWETGLRRTLYQWRHMRGDMVVSDFIACPLAIRSTGFGIAEEVDVVRTEADNPVVSRRFHVQISGEEDLEKIRMPVVTHDAAATEASYRAMCEVCEGIMPVRKVGRTHTWFTPWDFLIRWWGVTEAMLDLHDRPALVHAAVERMVAAWMRELDQLVEQNLMSLDCSNARVGSGGYGYTADLPGEDYDPAWVKPHNLWGCSNAQIFAAVSPETHWEFALRHDIPWLSRWGLNYYGCCEPLDLKMEIMRRIPRLRKVSMSFLVNPERAAQNVGGDYVFSYKPNPAFLAEHDWRLSAMRDELRGVLEKARGCHVEIILKDISTIRHAPQRLWEWERMAMELAEEFATG